MDEAFLKLLAQKDFAWITVKEICAEAGVNRSTFYLHYETIDDLLEESIHYLHESFLSCFTEKTDFVAQIRSCPKEKLYLATPEYLAPWLQFIKEHQRLYRTAMERPGALQAEQTYQKMFRYIFDPILERFLVPDAQRMYYMSFYLGGIMGIVAQWLKQDCAESVEQITEQIQNCITGPGKFV